MFCKKCGSLLKPNSDRKIMECACGYEQESNIKLKFSQINKDIEVVEKDEPTTRLIIDEECPECYNPKVEYWTQQTGPSDEPEDQIYRCLKCKHSWRENY